MIFIKQIFLAVIGVSSGLIVSAGVFTVLISVGLIPRFAGKMHVARRIFVLEEMVVFGTLFGGFFSIFSDWGMYFCRMSGAGHCGDAEYDSDFRQTNRIPARAGNRDSGGCAW